ncbi:MAG: hypothetical protein ACFFEE_10000 [Candidatus Thorarchaeota archaeon]
MSKALSGLTHNFTLIVEMIRTKTCPKCGNNRIAGPHKIYGQHHVRIDLPGFATATLESFTCTDCGYTEFYADSIGVDNIRRVGRFALEEQHMQPMQTSKFCPYCGTEVRVGSLSCKECGQFLS